MNLLMCLWAAYSPLSLWISQHKLNPFKGLLPFAANSAKGGCAVLWDTMNCVKCAPQRHQLHICSLSSLHLWFWCSQSLLNVQKGTLRVGGGPMPFERLTESFVKRERPWIYCTRRLIRMFNPLRSLHTHTHTTCPCNVRKGIRIWWN